LSASASTLPRLGKRKAALAGSSLPGLRISAPAQPRSRVSVEEIRQNGDRLVLERGVRVQQEHVVGRCLARGQLVQHDVVATTEAVVACLGDEVQPPGPAAPDDGAGNGFGIVPGRVVVHEVQLDPVAGDGLVPEHWLPPRAQARQCRN
jgi:hypothetical protein